LFREFLNGKSNHQVELGSKQSGPDFHAEECTSNNSSKSTPASRPTSSRLARGMMERTTDNKETAHLYDRQPTDYRLYTLMHDPQYREQSSRRT